MKEEHIHFFEILEKSKKLIIEQTKNMEIFICHIEFVLSFVDPTIKPYVWIFFKTDKELEQYSSDGATEIIKKNFSSIVEQFDSQYNNFNFTFDSEENVNKNYSGNYFYRLRG